jgi:hypothetical protein
VEICKKISRKCRVFLIIWRFPFPDAEQGVRGVQHFIDHLFSRDLVGNLILIALQSLQIESGCGFHLLENPSEWVPCLTDCWLTMIRDFIARNKITLKVALAHLVPTSRENDSNECHFAPNALRHGKISAKSFRPV